MRQTYLNRWSCFRGPHLSGEDELILRRRETLMAQAKARHPDRWGKRHTRDWTLPDVVWLNPEKREVLPEPTPLAA